MRCPTCERNYPPPARWWRGLWLWVFIVANASAMAAILLVPIPSLILECVRDALANGQATASCYPPTGALLFLGCLAWGALYTGVAGLFYWQARDVGRKNANRPRILRQMTRAGGRP